MHFRQSVTAFDARRPLVLGLLGVAAVLAGWMSWRSYAGAEALAGCGPAGGCSALLDSPYSRLFGLPVGVLGLAVYLAAFGAVLHKTVFITRLAALAILAGALWFLGVQALALRQWCPWCCLTHFLASGAALMVLGGSRNPNLFFRKKPVLSNGVWFLIFGSALAAAQLHEVTCMNKQIRTGMFSEKDNLLTVNDNGGLSLFDGKVVVDSRKLPVLGSLGFLSTAEAARNPLQGLVAPQPVVLLSDWTCPHCREFLAELMQLKSMPAGDVSTVAMGQPVAGAPVAGSPPAAVQPGAKASPLLTAMAPVSVILLPAWREAEGREIHRVMLSAWMASDALFRTLSGELTSGLLSANAADVLNRARALAGEAKWEIFQKQTAAAVEDALKTGESVLRESDALLTEGVLPRLLSVRGVLSGDPADAELVAFLQSGSEALSVQAGDLRKLSAPNDSRIEFTATALEAPPVAAGKTTRAVFHFSNTGTGPLNVVAVRTTCSCTAVSGWKQTVPPGGKGSVTVDVDTAGHTGVMTRQLTLVVNAGNAPSGGQIPLRVTARILPGAGGVPVSGTASAAGNTAVLSPAVNRRQVN
jgi:uncharacterized membrane protein